MDWINDELASERILVKDLEQDLFDGQILQKLIGQFTNLLYRSMFNLQT